MQPALGVMRWWLPVDASLHGRALDAHLLLNLWIALGLLALVHLLVLAGLVARRRAHRPIHTWTLEYVPLAGLVLLFGFLALRAQQLWAAQRYTGADLSAMQVEVDGHAVCVVLPLSGSGCGVWPDEGGVGGRGCRQSAGDRSRRMRRARMMWWQVRWCCLRGAR